MIKHIIWYTFNICNWSHNNIYDHYRVIVKDVYILHSIIKLLPLSEGSEALWDYIYRFISKDCFIRQRNILFRQKCSGFDGTIRLFKMLFFSEMIAILFQLLLSLFVPQFLVNIKNSDINKKLILEAFVLFPCLIWCYFYPEDRTIYW